MLTEGPDLRRRLDELDLPKKVIKVGAWQAAFMYNPLLHAMTEIVRGDWLVVVVVVAFCGLTTEY